MEGKDFLFGSLVVVLEERKWINTSDNCTNSQVAVNSLYLYKSFMKNYHFLYTYCYYNVLFSVKKS